ncbi:uncharacterized protein LOC110960864 isoform X2 [Acanthochromis polyacanthus]|nr:uncharacterized protein LOC110960864 isoform X2 [Acanthochromis polyacanthus]XP_051809529.1 uncharacterized protein LOC110960864 isoform X2 [Acanthochromis polyacanthus]
MNLTTILPVSQPPVEFPGKCEHCGEQATPSLDTTWLQELEKTPTFCCSQRQQLCETMLKFNSLWNMSSSDCYRLKKTEKRHEADAATTTGVLEGTIVFGKAFQIGSGLESHISDGTRRTSSNGSVEDETSYQADSVGWEKGYMHDISSGEAEWKHLSPTLQCLKDQMKFRVVGPAVSHLLLERGYRSPLPLSHIPPSCGYKVQKNSMALHMLVPYNGCNVYQKGGSYVVPLSFKGYPISLVCPKPAHTTPGPHYTVPAHLAKHPNLKFPPFYLFPYPKYPVLPDHAHKPELPKYPLYHHLLPHHYYLPDPPKTTLPSTESEHHFAHSHLFALPLYQHVPPHYLWHYHESDHTDTTKPQVPYHHVLPYVSPFHHPQYPKHPVPYVTAPTTTTVTPHSHPHYPPHSHPHYLLHHLPHYPPHSHPHFPPHGHKHPSHGDHIQLEQIPLP